MARAGAIGVVLAAALSGCAGTEIFNDDLPSPYVGTWSGTWTNVLRSEGGALTLNVATSGAATGTATYGTGVNGVFTGSVDFDGTIRGAIDFPTHDFTNINGGLRRVGANVEGGFAYRFRGTNEAATVVLIPGAPAP